MTVGLEGRVSRQDFLKVLGVGAGLALAGGYEWPKLAVASTPYSLAPQPAAIQLASRRVKTIAYNGVLPGTELRAKEGDIMAVAVRNHLSEPTVVHWHGIPIPNKMDGVVDITQPAIKPGGSFVYRFPLKVSGTYWYHSHYGMQIDRGLYGPLIIEPKREALSYDREAVLVFDDWMDGFSAMPMGFNHANRYYCDVSTLEGSRAIPQSATARSHAGFGFGPTVPTSYPLYLISGKPASNPMEVQIKRGDVIRLRLINASAATTYRVAVAGHSMQVTHSDGLPVKPVTVDALDIGMGERYDVLVRANNPGVWQVAAALPGGRMVTRAVLRYGGIRSAAPTPNLRPGALSGRLLSYDMLHAAPGLSVPLGKPDVVLPITLINKFGSFLLQVNGQYPDVNNPIRIPLGKHVRFTMVNSSTEIHPIHLHGHSFQLGNPSGNGAMKDTVMVPPRRSISADWIADNPGTWLIHCHNHYHMMLGMIFAVKVG